MLGILSCECCCSVTCDVALCKILFLPVTTSIIYKRPLWMKEWAYIQEVDRHCHLLLLGSREDCKQISIFAPTTQNRFPAASSWGSESCLEQRVNSWQEAIKVSFIHSHYCFYVFAIMFIDMFEQSTSCSSVQLPVKMGHLSRNKPRSF